MPNPILSEYQAAVSALASGCFEINVQEAGDHVFPGLGRAINSLAHALEERSLEQRRLARVAERVQQALCLDEVLGQVFSTFESILPYDMLIHVTADGAGRGTVRWSRARAGTTALPVGTTFLIAESVLGLASIDAQPHIFPQLRRHAAEFPNATLAGLMARCQMDACLVCPLLGRNTLPGGLIFASPNPCAYSSEHARMLSELSSQLALLIDKSRIYEELVLTKRALVKANRELEQMAMLDGLTGIPNRRCLDQRLEQEWRRMLRDRRDVSLIMIDVDHFKQFNDQFGHLAGDACLRRVAETLKGRLRRADDFVARFGGEEFACLMSGAGFNVAVRAAEQLRHDVAVMARGPAGPTAHVTVSVGVASTIPDEHHQVEQLVAGADRALYAAKRRGRNRVVAVDLSGELGPDIRDVR